MKKNHISAGRMQLIKPSPTLEIAANAAAMKAAGEDVISLSMGESDFDTPEYIKVAAIEAINSGKTKYTAVDGMPALKKAICQKFERENQLSYNPSNISVGSGAKQVIFNAIMATVEQGDEVIIPIPYWVSYPDIVLFAGGTPVFVSCSNEFKLTPSALNGAITKRTKWVILNSPSNPTGVVYSYDELKAIAEVLLAHPHVQLMTDDIYEHLVFDGLKFYTMAQVEPSLKDRILTVNGVSKAYAMTGWRIGYGAGNPELIKMMCVVQSQSTSNPCSVSQFAVLAALQKSPELKQKEIFMKRRDLVLSIFNDIPEVSCKKPEGAFYIFADCHRVIGMRAPGGKIIANDYDFANYLLEEAKVAVVPGSAFGMDNFFRMTYTASDDVLREACSRIKTTCSKLV